MGFWGGIGKMFEGLNETAEAVVDFIPDSIRAVRREYRKQNAKKYTIRIDATSEHPELIAKFTYFGPCTNDDTLYEVNIVTHVDSSIDVWDSLSPHGIREVHIKINAFLWDLEKKKQNQ